ncbi:MAG TPA: hypothetical protein VMM18_06890 [Gemmatimonadaceae bacterium]|nr:hypothetical protein [Gemmatimonadaceae bacterium]
MPPVLRPRLWVLGLCALTAAGCERAESPPTTDTSAAHQLPVPEDTLALTPAGTGWNPEAGAALLVAGESPQYASVVLPDATGALSDTLTLDASVIADSRVDLFSRTGRVGAGYVAGVLQPTSGDCVAWPYVRVIPDAKVPPNATWTLALLEGAAAPLPADSMGALSRGDSIRFSAEILRLASRIRDDAAQDFRGLPFVARTIFRFRPEPGIEALVSDVVRRISTEANPREEHTLLVAERDSASSEPFERVYHERTSGPEETVIASDALAMLSIGDDRRPTLVISRDNGSGTVYSLLERVGPRQWRVRWSSAYAGC